MHGGLHAVLHERVTRIARLELLICGLLTLELKSCVKFCAVTVTVNATAAEAGA